MCIFMSSLVFLVKSVKASKIRLSIILSNSISEINFPEVIERLVSTVTVDSIAFESLYKIYTKLVQTFN